MAAISPNATPSGGFRPYGARSNTPEIRIAPAIASGSASSTRPLGRSSQMIQWLFGGLSKLVARSRAPTNA